MFFSRKKRQLAALKEISLWNSGDTVEVTDYDLTGHSSTVRHTYLLHDESNVYLHGYEDGETYKITTIPIEDISLSSVINTTLKRKKDREYCKKMIEKIDSLRNKSVDDDHTAYWVEKAKQVMGN